MEGLARILGAGDAIYLQLGAAVGLAGATHFQQSKQKTAMRILPVSVSAAYLAPNQA